MNHTVSESTDEDLSESLNEAADSSKSSSCSSGDDGSSSSSGSSTASTSDTSETTENESQNDALELAQLGGKIFRLPRGLCENANIFYEFFSVETWQMLPEQIQAQLQEHLPRFSHLLPPEEAAAEQARTIALLFKGTSGGHGGLHRFGETPLCTLQRQLEEGNLRPDVLKLRQSIAKSQRRERRFQQCERVSHLAKELFISRERLLRNAYKSAPDCLIYTTRMQRKRQKLEMPLQDDNNLCAVRARKRYCSELHELVKDLQLNFADISADEDDPEALTVEERYAVDKMPSDANDDAATMAKNANKKSIYDTFFRRQKDRDDEDVIRAAQETKHTRLTDKNFKQYLRDYKRRKLREPQLPEFDTTDIRLRDVCTRAHMSGLFKPGRKPKAKQNEPPALVPIQHSKDIASQHTASASIRKEANHENVRFEDDDGSLNVVDMDTEIDVQQEEVVTQNMSDIEILRVRNDVEVLNELPQQVLKTPERERPIPKLEPISSPVKLNKLKTPPQTKSPMMRISPTVLAPALMQETHSCYFSLIRDLFCATPNHRMRYEELKAKLEIWLANPIAALNDWYNQATNWVELLQSAVSFLAGSFTVLPAEYVPYIEHKTQLNIYQWIGASRDSDARLIMLYNFWLQRRKDAGITLVNLAGAAKAYIQPKQIDNITGTTTGAQIVNLGPNIALLASASITEQQMQFQQDDELHMLEQQPTIIHTMIQTPPTPPPRCPTNWTVRAATPAEVAEFQRQERARFEQPHRAFTYRMHGYESVVGPVKGIYSQTLALTKARGHSIMVDDRPNFVTILTLVRDATARLPNGAGTRAEISELLKCSQYINPHAAENVLQTIVSGALDRMHAGHDPCVRYDPKRKIWIYLHRNRSESEFERMHQNHQTMGKQKQKINRKPKIVTTKKDGTIIESDGSMQIIQNDIVNKPHAPLPALVPSSSGTLLLKKPIGQQQQQQSVLMQQQQQQHTLAVKCPPVPPLKYNIPNQQHQQQQQQQKSLLKTPLQATQKLQTQLLTNPRLKITPGTSSQVKQYTFPVQQTNKVGAGTQANIATIRNVSAAATGTTTPILVSTPTGLQTVHVANTTPVTNSTITATLGGKKVSLAKPIVINQMQTQQQQHLHQVNKLQKQQQQQQQQLGNIILSMESNQQQHQTHTLSNVTMQKDQLQNVLIDNSQLITATTSQHQQTKNIIRLMPTTTTAAGGSNSAAKHPVQIIGHRVLAQTTVRPMHTTQQQQQKTIGTLTVAGKSNSSAGGGTVVKMSPQAFAALQQKQGQQLVVKPTIGNQPAQRIVVGNTAISANKNIVFQPITGQKITTSTASQTQNANIGTAKIVTTPTGGKIQTLNTTNLTPQQQRVLFQNLKQQQQQMKTNAAQQQTETMQTQVVPRMQTTQRVMNLADARAQVIQQQQQQQQQQPIVVSQATTATGQVTRIIRTTNPMGTSGQQQQHPTTGQIITLDNLLQKQGGTLRVATNSVGSVGGSTKVVSAANIIQLSSNAGGTSITNTGSTSAQFQVVSPPRSIITLGPTSQPRFITTQAGGSAAVLTTPTGPTVSSKLAAGRLVATNATKVLGKTTTATVMGTNANASGGAINIANLQGKQMMLPTVKNVVRTATGQTQQLQNVVIGGQTVKLHNAATSVQRTGNMVPTSQIQTAIMGNLRLQQSVLRLQQLPTAQQQQQQQHQQRIAIAGGTTNVGGVAINNSETAVGATSTGTTTQSIVTNMPKTLVLGSTGQTIRLQSANNTQKNIVVASNAGTNVISKATTSNNAGNVLFAVQGGGQILLSPAFQGGTLNLKPLQNMKVVSLPMSKAQQTVDNKILTSVAATGTGTSTTTTISPKLVHLKSNHGASGGSGIGGPEGGIGS